MKQVIDNLNDFVTYMAVNYTTMPFDEIVIGEPDQTDSSDLRHRGAKADVIPLHCSIANR